MLDQQIVDRFAQEHRLRDARLGGKLLQKLALCGSR